MKICFDVRFKWDDDTWIFEVPDELQDEMYLAMLDNDRARYRKAELKMLERENNGAAL